MGRSQPTYHDLLDRIENEWGEYRRALRDRRQEEAFQRLLQKARAHANAASKAARPDPVESAFLSILLEHELELQDLRRRLQEREG